MVLTASSADCFLPWQEDKFKLALRVYTRALGIVNEEHMYKDEEKAESASVRNTLRLNLAAVLLKLNEGQEAKEHCMKVLKNDEANVKAFFRRGQVGTGDGSMACSEDIEGGN